MPNSRPAYARAANGGSAQPHALLFISDLHLSPALPRTVAAFERFIDATVHSVERADAVYILGDLFDAWIGDDMLRLPFVARIAKVLHSLADRGIALYVMRGNRDFLLGPKFAAAAGATLLPDPFLLNVFGKRIVLTHGDLLCTDDQAYQRFRRFVRKPRVQRFFLAWPFAWRHSLASGLRQRSSAAAPLRMASSDVARAAVRQMLEDSRADIMIHGHTHRPWRHLEGAAIRWVLTDWDLDTARPRAGYLKLDAQGVDTLRVDG